MRVSILISSHNYARFLGEAIDSALAQRDGGPDGLPAPEVEVIVCDDASSDGSDAVIRCYGTRIRHWISPDNRGQASMMNAAMALSTGDWVLFLDADDRIEPQALAHCLERLCAEPDGGRDVAKIQFLLRCIDREGRCMSRTIPYLMHDGDVRPLIRRFGSYGGPPSSGNLYRRSAIARYFPLVEADWRRAADTPPFILAPFHGRVLGIDAALGAYRIHSGANRARGCFGNIAARHADTLRVDLHRREASLALLARHGGERIEGPFLPAPWNLRTRVLSWRTEPQRHPYRHDDALRLLRLQARSLRECPGYTRPERYASQLWLMAMLVAPTSLASRMAVTNTSGRLRRWLRRLRPDTAVA